RSLGELPAVHDPGTVIRDRHRDLEPVTGSKESLRYLAEPVIHRCHTRDLESRIMNHGVPIVQLGLTPTGGVPRNAKQNHIEVISGCEPTPPGPPRHRHALLG